MSVGRWHAQAVDIRDPALVIAAKNALNGIGRPLMTARFVESSMRATERIAAVAEPVDGLPAERIQTMLSRAVHEAIITYIGQHFPKMPMTGKCGLYAVVMSEVCSATLGQRFDVYAGSFSVPINERGDELQLRPSVIRLDAATRASFPYVPEGVSDQHPVLAYYHAVCVSNSRNGRVHVVDSAARYYPDLARTAGGKWLLAAPPHLSWTLQSQRASDTFATTFTLASDSRFEAEAVPTAMLRAMFENDNHIPLICKLAMGNLVVALEGAGLV